jgi:KipI family sensor histidine kinase inhibitor
MTATETRIRRVADDRFAVTVESTADGQALAAELARLDGCIDAVGAIASVEVRFDAAATPAAEFSASMQDVLAVFGGAGPGRGRLHEIPVVYGGEAGPDLDAVCAQLGLSADEFIDRHGAGDYTVAMLGFTPGFAYLDGMDPGLAVPRRNTPRSDVPAGSVGIAGPRAGIYSLQGPGGWRIVGRTSRRLFDPAAQDPFLFAPGDRVRFVAAVG